MVNKNKNQRNNHRLIISLRPGRPFLFSTAKKGNKNAAAYEKISKNKFNTLKEKNSYGSCLTVLRQLFFFNTSFIYFLNEFFRRRIPQITSYHLIMFLGPAYFYWDEICNVRLENSWSSEEWGDHMNELILHKYFIENQNKPWSFCFIFGSSQKRRALPAWGNYEAQSSGNNYM